MTAVVNVKSTTVFNQDATPPILSPRTQLQGANYNVTDFAAIGATDSATSTYRIVRLPSNALITKIALINDGLTGGTSYNLGFYNTLANGGTVVNSGNEIATAIDLHTARTAPLETRWLTLTASSAGQLLWQILGFTADTGLLYDLTLTAVTPATAGGNVQLVVNYSA